MATIKQIIAEIQLAPDLPPNHKIKACQIIRDAEERLKLKLGTKPRKITNAKDLMSLELWEHYNGRLETRHMALWIANQGLSNKIVGMMIEEFRTEMLAKGKEYANFKMAFQTYLTKGYLSKEINDCLLSSHKSEAGTTVHNRGVDL